jgi:hypothetical protein
MAGLIVQNRDRVLSSPETLRPLVHGDRAAPITGMQEAAE